jgi:hypothetical protein
VIESSGQHYIYRHIRLDTNTPFYIGLGTKQNKDRICAHRTEFSRAYSKASRYPAWKSIVERVGYRVEILLQSNDYEFINEKEIEFIKIYGKICNGTGSLVNLTDGGGGVKGFLMNDERKKKIGDANRGNKANLGRKASDETKIIMSISAKKRGICESTRIANLEYLRSNENRERMSKRQTGVIIPEETRKKISEKLKGRKLSQETLIKRSKTTTGVPKKNREGYEITSAKLSIPIIQLDKQGNIIKEWKSMTEAGLNGFSISKISLCCNNKRPFHKEYKWQFK